MEELEREVADRLDAMEGGDAAPVRVYAFYEDDLPAPAVYLEVVEDGDVVPVIAHNFRYYERAMRRWDVGVVEAVVLNELHELTHWAMTDAERADLDERSRDYGLPDGYWLNGPLLDVIEWLADDYPAVLDGKTSRLRRFRRRLAWPIRRVLPGIDP